MNSADPSGERIEHLVLSPRDGRSGHENQSVVSVVFDIGEALITGRAFQRAAFGSRLPLHNVLDLLRQIEVLVGYALGGVVL